MFERLTEGAAEVVALAREESRFFGHARIGTEHLLLALTIEPDLYVARVLGDFGVTHERTQGWVEDSVGRGEARIGKPMFSALYKAVLEEALREATERGRERISPADMLLGLLRIGESTAARMMSDLGTDMEGVRCEATRLADSTRDTSDTVGGTGRTPSRQTGEDTRSLLSKPLTARTLQRVVGVGQKREAAGITLALTALEVHEVGVSVLRYMLAAESGAGGVEEGTVGIPMLSVTVEDAARRTYEVFRGETGGWGLEARGTLKVIGIPVGDANELTVRVDRIRRERMLGLGPEYEALPDQVWEGPWEFRFSV